MKQLTKREEACLQLMLENEKRKAEEYMKNYGDSPEVRIIKNETLPMIENLLSKIEL